MSRNECQIHQWHPDFPEWGTNPENCMEDEKNRAERGVHRKFVYVDLPLYILYLKIFLKLQCDLMHRTSSAEVKDPSLLFKITLIPVHLIRICFK